MTPLEQMIAPSAHVAVDKAIHEADPYRFHKRYPKGKCPQCTLAQNLLGYDNDIAERIREAVALVLRDL